MTEEERKEKKKAWNKKWKENNREKNKAYMRKWHQDNKERSHALRKKNYEDNKEKIIAKQRVYEKENKEKISIARKKSYKNNKEEILTKQKKYYHLNKEMYSYKNKIKRKLMTGEDKDRLNEYIREWKKKDKKKRPWYGLVNENVKHRARKKGLEFNLTKEWAEERWTGKCELTGIPFDLEERQNQTPPPKAPSLDRIDNSKGYTKDNCRFILYCVNALKNVMCDKDMLIIAGELIKNYQNA